MKRLFTPVLVLCVVLAGCGTAGSPVNVHADPAAAKLLRISTHSATTPTPKTVKWWMPRHEANAQRLAAGNINLLMIGDSITKGWEDNGKTVWDAYYGNRNALNMGFGGDKTEHVLWRLNDLSFDTISPKLAVLMIGTNNTARPDTAEQIADGITAIVLTLRQKLPDTKVLILDVFPRADGGRDDRVIFGETIKPGQQWQTAMAAGAQTRLTLDGVPNVYFLNVNHVFLDDNDEISRDIMPDLLHLNQAGYALWAAAMERQIASLMSAP